LQSLITGGSLIQSTFGGAGRHNLEAVITRPNGQLFDLRHYWRDMSVPDKGWQQGALIAFKVMGPAALCQRHDHDNVPGNFEAVVPMSGGMAHFFLDNSQSGNRPWIPVAGFAAPGADGPGAILENRTNSNLELVALEGRNLVHYWFDMQAWRRNTVITSRATGAPAIIQSDYDNHLEVVVPEDGNLALYWFDGSVWRPGGILAVAGDGPAGFVQGRYGEDPHRNFEVVVPRGDTLMLYWRENNRENIPWRPGGVATWGAGPVRAAALCSTDIGDGWLHAITQEGTSIYNLYRHRLGDGFRWMRGSCIRLDDTAACDIDPQHQRSGKMAQVTGQPDAQHPQTNTLSNSRTVSGIHGTDLGVTVEHADRRFLLFGDTHWDNGGWITLDSIAEVHPQPDPNRPNVVMHGSPLHITGGPVTQDVYDVPLDAFSLGGDLYLFFSSDHFQDDKVMGRSVLTRALNPNVPIDGDARNNPLEYQLLTTFSSYRFINVSVQLRPASTVPGFGKDGQVLLVWGSGAYRADDLRLALIDLRDPAILSYLRDDRTFPVDYLAVRYLTGMCGDTPLWSLREVDARPVLWPAALGELSVRWVPAIERYVLMGMTGPEDPLGRAVWMRTARNPWGPWSRRRQVFDWWLDGVGRRNPVDRSGQFIRDPEGGNPVGDCIFPEQCNSGGGAYAPYLHEVHLLRGVATFRYLLSTWNPYQVMLMNHTVGLDQLRALET
jgi:hypothetical protein